MVNLKPRSLPTRVSQMAIRSAISVLRDLPPKHQSDRSLKQAGNKQSDNSSQNTLAQFFQSFSKILR